MEMMETDPNKTYDDEFFVGRDVFGYPYNKKYPPDYQKYGSQFSGYATPNQEFFFYDYAVLRYDGRFTYKGTDYFIVNWGDCFALTDRKMEVMYQTFPDAIALIENLEIDGRKLLDFMEEIEDVEAL